MAAILKQSLKTDMLKKQSGTTKENNGLIAIVSLGCAKNLVDSELMSGLLQTGGYEITDVLNQADVIVVNTCGFIEPAKQEAVDRILEAGKLKKRRRSLKVIAAGCLAQRYGQELLDEIPELDAVIGTGEWRSLPQIIERVRTGERVVAAGQTPLDLQRAEDSRKLLTPEYSVYLKVADGCSNRCAYCAIPIIRGDMRSRTLEDIVAEAGLLVQRGVKEINLIAQDTTNYGYDLYGRSRLTELLEAICALPGDFWVRILYCYPRHLSDEIIDCMARQPKICKYIDLPLQHSADNVLRAMLRKDSRVEVTGLIEKLRLRIPEVAIRTTFITGFPGETEADVRDLLEFIREQRFEHAGVFEYSAEEGTPAYDYSGQISAAVKNERYHQLMAAQSAVSETVNREKRGRIMRLLVEGQEDGQYYGRSQYEAPDVDGKIYIETGAELIPGQWLDVRIVEGFAYDLLAEPV